MNHMEYMNILLSHMRRERNYRLEKIGDDIHPWTYDQDLGEQVDIQLDNNEADEDIIKHFQEL